MPANRPLAAGLVIFEQQKRDFFDPNQQKSLFRVFFLRKPLVFKGLDGVY